MGWIRSNKKSAGGGGIEVTKIVEGGAVYSGGSQQTITFSDISSYTWVYIRLVEVNYNNYKDQPQHTAIRSIKVSDIPANGYYDFRYGYLWDSGADPRIRIARTYVTCWYSTNNYNQYVDVIVTNEPIF